MLGDSVVVLVRYFHYADANGVIRIRAGRRPSEHTKPKRGTWVVRELGERGWQMPVAPEITWGTLKTLEYVGSTPAKSD